MGRRSDHTREELRELILEEGHRQLSEVGFARFSAREVAKGVGYSIGTIYNVFGSYNALMLALLSKSGWQAARTTGWMRRSRPTSILRWAAVMRGRRSTISGCRRGSCLRKAIAKRSPRLPG